MSVVRHMSYWSFGTQNSMVTFISKFVPRLGEAVPHLQTNVLFLLKTVILALLTHKNPNCYLTFKSGDKFLDGIQRCWLLCSNQALSWFHWENEIIEDENWYWLPMWLLLFSYVLELSLTYFYFLVLSGRTRFILFILPRRHCCILAIMTKGETTLFWNRDLNIGSYLATNMIPTYF